MTLHPGKGEFPGSAGSAPRRGRVLPQEITSARGESDGPKILLFQPAESPQRSFSSTLKRLGHPVKQARTPDRALQILRSQRIALLITDVMNPDLGGISLCRAVRESLENPLLPVIALGSKARLEDEVAAMEAGADLFLERNVNPRALRASVEGCLRRKAAIDALDETETVLFSLAQSVEQRDPALGQHCDRLALIAAALGVAIGLGAKEILALQRGAYLHDIGKVAIPDRVLFKPGPLDDDEWALMKSHAERGERICRNVRSLSTVLPIIRHHHERWDGGGYPDGLRGEDIPLLARITQFADIYDALTTARPYKRAFAAAEAVAIMQQETDKGWRDPKLMKTFTELQGLFSEPEKAELSQLSLQALASAVEQKRREPARQEPLPLQKVSGL